MKTDYIILGLAILASLLITQIPASEDSALGEFNKFKTDYGKVYRPEEELYRFNIFIQNLAKIETHNADPKQTYMMGVTQFADMTGEEFVGIIFLLFRKNINERSNQ